MHLTSKFLLVCAVLFILWVVWTLAFVNPIIMNYTQGKIEAMTVVATNRAVNSVVGSNTYSEILMIKHDSNGKIQSLTVNTLQINNLSSDIALIAQQEMDLLSSTGIAVPLGTFSGWQFLTGVGPNVHLRVVPVGSVNCAFKSEFTAAGINQTRHRILLQVHCVVNLVMPLAHRYIDVVIEALMAESVIVGEVPEFMLTR